MTLKATINKTEFAVGDTVRVHHQFKDKDKTQTQVFEGIVIKIKGRELGKSFTVRKIAADSIGVEKIWPVHSPNIKKIIVKKKGNPKRSKLYYLRSRKGREALKVKSVKSTSVKKITSSKKKK